MVKSTVSSEEAEVVCTNKSCVKLVVVISSVESRFGEVLDLYWITRQRTITNDL